LQNAKNNDKTRILEQFRIKSKFSTPIILSVAISQLSVGRKFAVFVRELHLLIRARFLNHDAVAGDAALKPMIVAATNERLRCIFDELQFAFHQI